MYDLSEVIHLDEGAIKWYENYKIKKFLAKEVIDAKLSSGDVDIWCDAWCEDNDLEPIFQNFKHLKRWLKEIAKRYVKLDGEREQIIQVIV